MWLNPRPLPKSDVFISHEFVLQSNRFQAVSSPRTGCSCGVGSPWPVSGPDRVRAAAVLGHAGREGKGGNQARGPALATGPTCPALESRFPRSPQPGQEGPPSEVRIRVRGPASRRRHVLQALFSPKMPGFVSGWSGGAWAAH